MVKCVYTCINCVLLRLGFTSTYNQQSVQRTRLLCEFHEFQRPTHDRAHSSIYYIWKHDVRNENKSEREKKTKTQSSKAEE